MASGVRVCFVDGMDGMPVRGGCSGFQTRASWDHRARWECALAFWYVNLVGIGGCDGWFGWRCERWDFLGVCCWVRVGLVWGACGLCRGVYRRHPVGPENLLADLCLFGWCDCVCQLVVVCSVIADKRAGVGVGVCLCKWGEAGGRQTDGGFLSQRRP